VEKENRGAQASQIHIENGRQDGDDDGGGALPSLK